MIRKPEKRHSVELEALEENDQRPYRYVLKKNRTLFPRPRFHSKHLDAKEISCQQAEFTLKHLVLKKVKVRILYQLCQVLLSSSCMALNWWFGSYKLLVWGIIVRQYASSLLGSYVQQE